MENLLKRGGEMKDPLISIIIPCKNEGENVLNTINSIREKSGSTSCELVVVDDASDDGCCDFLRERKKDGVTLINTKSNHADIARNAGAETADGDIFVFCDPHIFVENNWLETLTDTLTVPGIDAVSPRLKPLDDETVSAGGLTWGADLALRWLPGSDGIIAVPVLPKSCLAITREAFEAVAGFDEGFHAYGYEDVEFTLKLWLFGFGAYVNSDAAVKHIFRGARPYTVSNSDIHYNLLRMAILHFNQERLSRVIAKIKNYQYFNDIFTDVILSDAPERRCSIIKRRVKDDDWYFQKFNIPL